MSNKKPIVINLFGPSGSGKSTTSLGLTYELKKLGYKCEIASEWVKEEVFAGNFNTLQNQLYIFANQHRKQFILNDKELDFIICDSPLLLSSFYGNKYKTSSPALNQLVFQEFHSFKNLNFLLKRTVPFETLGRMESEEQSDEDYANLTDFLKNHNIVYFDVTEEEKTIQILKYMKNLGI